ncbi:MAG: hypothetical protein OEY49_19765, partial [Candidatus Heimdallarchaeota archaeon]|nr:hypothetical protein [Candidatus Heimdallarchaeota archaeon]
MICKSCSLQVEEIANALTSGCKNCGNRVFSSQSISEKIGLDSNSIVEKLDVDVKILGKGVFKLNIESVSKKA